MSKIGIVTLLDNKNYGNRLQNFAVQKILENYVEQVETLKFKYVATEEQMRLSNRFKRALKRGLYNNFALLTNRVKHKMMRDNTVISELYKLRIDNFELFNDRYINFGKDEIINDIFDKEQDYLAFFVGSDQVWNPDYVNCKDVYFLTFAEPSKRFSIAASFGVGELTSGIEVQYAQKLSDFQAISVREFSGSELVKSLTSKSCTTMLDPTLILEPERWKSLKRTPSDLPKNGFVLTYFIGSNIEEKQLEARKCADNMGVEVIYLNSIEDKDRFITGVEGFLGYFYNASIVLTDSFHGTAFSIIFEKEFYVFERNDGGKSMFSRIATLLKITDIGNRKYYECYDDVNDSIKNHIDYTNVRRILKEEREKAMQFIENCVWHNRL